MARARAIDTRLEKLLPSLDEYFVVGVFTKPEIRDIVRQRTHHEYKLVAKPLLLIDVRNAIAYENTIESRVAEKCRATKATLKHRFVIQDRIDKIFQIGLRRLPELEREELRQEYIQFLVASGRQASLSKHYALMIQRYPMKPNLWIDGAMWEVQSGNIDNARSIVQQAMRTLTRSVDVYVTALNVELEFAKRCLDEILAEAKRTDDESNIIEKLAAENESMSQIVVQLALATIVVQSVVDADLFNAEFFSRAYKCSLKYPFTATFVRELTAIAGEKISGNPTEVAKVLPLAGSIENDLRVAGVVSCSEYINLRGELATALPSPAASLCDAARQHLEVLALESDPAVATPLQLSFVKILRAAASDEALAVSRQDISELLKGAILLQEQKSSTSSVLQQAAKTFGVEVGSANSAMLQMVSSLDSPRRVHWTLATAEFRTLLKSEDLKAVLAVLDNLDPGQQVTRVVESLALEGSTSQDIRTEITRFKKSRKPPVQIWQLYVALLRAMEVTEGDDDDDDDDQFVKTAKEGVTTVGRISAATLTAAESAERQQGLLVIVQIALAKLIGVPEAADATSFTREAGREILRRAFSSSDVAEKCQGLLKLAGTYVPTSPNLTRTIIAFEEAAIASSATKSLSQTRMLYGSLTAQTKQSAAENAADWVSFVRFERDVAKDHKAAAQCSQRATREAAKPQLFQKLLLA